MEHVPASAQLALVVGGAETVTRLTCEGPDPSLVWLTDGLTPLM